MKFGVITRTWQALIKVLGWQVIVQSWRTEDEHCGAAWLFLCVHSLVSVACGAAQLSGPQGLTFSCAALLLFSWAKSILSRAGETSEIALIIYLTSFAQNCLLGMPCALSPASAEPRWLGTCLCFSQPVRAWSCCCNSLCAAGAEPLLHRESPCLCWESRMGGKTCGRQQKQQMMGMKVRGSGGWQKKKDRNNVFTICFEYVLRLAMVNFKECIPPSSLSSSWQAGSGLVLQAQGKHTPLGQRWGWRLVKIVPLPAIHIWDKWKHPFACQILLAAITMPLSSSFKPTHCQLFRALSHSLRSNAAPPHCKPEQGC